MVSLFKKRLVVLETNLKETNKSLCVYNMFKRKSLMGFSLIEMMIVIGIISIVSVIAVFSFSNMNKDQALDKDSLLILSVLGDARSLAMSSKYFSDYGVHFNNDSAVLFKGDSFNQNDSSNSLYYINHLVSISNISLAGGSSNVIFKKVSGETDNSGTIIISLSDDASVNKIITIFPTGSSEKN